MYNIERYPGKTGRIIAAQTRTDAEDIALSKKIVTLPYINNGVRASFVIPLADTDGNLTLTALVPGEDGNLYTCRCLINGSGADNIDISWSSPNLQIGIKSGVNMPVFKLVSYIQQNYPELLDVFAFVYDQSDAEKIIEEATLDYFSGGTDPVSLTSTSEEIDDTVADVQTETTGLKDRVTVLEAKSQVVPNDTPVAPVAASGSIEVDTGISLDFTAITAGEDGDDIRVNLIDPETTGALSIDVDETVINVTLAYDTDHITSTIAEVKAALNLDAGASALILADTTGLDTTVAIEDSVALDGGVDGTVGVLGAMMFDGNYLYISTRESTTAVSFWKSISFDEEE